MDFSNVKLNLSIRIVTLALTTFLLAHLFYSEDSALTSVLILFLAIFQVVSIINFIERSNKSVFKLLNSLREENLVDLDEINSEKDIRNLSEGLDNVIEKFRKARSEKEAQYHYMKTIVQHVGIGIITFDRDGDIQIMNTAARKLLNVGQLTNISQLGSINNALIDVFKHLKTGGRELIKLEREGNTVQLSIYAIELTLQGKEFKLVSLQNIQSELEEKEMEAWQNLIRVLTHEIMNSVTPISSLASLVEGELENYLDNGNPQNSISDDEVKDIHLSIHTIHKRSEGLIRFVNDFRNLTRVPDPKISEHRLKDIFDQINTLLKFEFDKSGVELVSSVEPEELKLQLDRELIEQVLINLVKNAIQSFDGEERDHKKVEFLGYKNRKGNIEIVVRDNGPGIEEEALTKIFIPFFTTKKTGSGIGLSLSRQIIRKHNGVLTVSSQIDEGTEFMIRF
ncbi:MAG: ATP-binding protein [Bacteroidota bacterium]